MLNLNNLSGIKRMILLLVVTVVAVSLWALTYSYGEIKPTDFGPKPGVTIIDNGPAVEDLPSDPFAPPFIEVLPPPVEEPAVNL